MTVCIAAICDNNQSVVVASDRMLSAHFLALEFDHPDAKIDILASRCVGLSAGDALPTGELFGACAGISAQLSNPQIELIATHVKDKYSELRRKFIEEKLFKPRGITIDDFYQGGIIRQLPPDVSLTLDDRVQRTDYSVELIVAGVDSGGASIFGIVNPGISSCYNRVGYHSIGSGMSHALLSLVSSGQHWSTDLNRSVYNVYCAKKQAELAQGVGNATEMRIVTQSGIRSVAAKEMETLEKIRTSAVTPMIKGLDSKIGELPFGENGDAGE